MTRIGNPLKSVKPKTRSDADSGVSGGSDANAPSTSNTSSTSSVSSPFTASGPLAAESSDTFEKLSGDVSSGKLSATAASLLAGGAGQLGVIGEAEALRAAQRAESLAPADRATFDGLLQSASSPLAQTFLYKALGAGYPVSDVATFASQIASLSDAQLLDRLSLAADLGADGGSQDGVKQQWEASCVPTTAQALRGEFDPIYALAVRGNNPDISAANDQDGTAINPNLAAEQKALLEGPGTGKATPRSQSFGARGSTDLDAVYDQMAPYTGYDFHVARFDHLHDLAQTDGALDAMAGQLAQGIPTPFRVTGDQGGGHAVLAMAVEGTGADQRFLVHDPWEGKTLWVTRQQFEQDSFNIAGWHSLGGYGAASPAPVQSPAA